MVRRVIAALLTMAVVRAWQPRSAPPAVRHIRSSHGRPYPAAASSGSRPTRMVPPCAVGATEMLDSTTLVVSDLVSATEVYLPIFIAGVVLAFSGFGSAMVLGSLIDEDNVDEVGW